MRKELDALLEEREHITNAINQEALKLVKSGKVIRLFANIDTQQLTKEELFAILNVLITQCKLNSHIKKRIAERYLDYVKSYYTDIRSDDVLRARKLFEELHNDKDVEDCDNVIKTLKKAKEIYAPFFRGSMESEPPKL